MSRVIFLPILKPNFNVKVFKNYDSENENCDVTPVDHQMTHGGGGGVSKIAQ
jgi:hypothetical protein